MEKYTHLLTPFHREKGTLTSSGRTLVAATSAKKMTDEVKFGDRPGGQFTSKDPNVHKAAVDLATKIINAGLIASERRGVFASMTLEQILEWEQDMDVRLEKKEEDPADPSEVAKGLSADERLASVILARKMIHSAASSEISRLQKKLTGDLLITELARREAEAGSSPFTTICRAFEATRTKPNEATRLGTTLRSDVIMRDSNVKEPNTCVSILGEIQRYTSEANAVLQLVGLSPLVDLERKTILIRATEGSVIQARLAECDRVSLMNDPMAEPKSFTEVMTYLEAVFRAEADREESVRRPATKAVVVGNARSNKKKGRELRESSGNKPPARDGKKTPEKNERTSERSSFFEFIKENPGTCFRCKKPGHLKKDCPENSDKATAGGAYVCLPAAYRAAPTRPDTANVIFDTGAAAASYVSSPEGIDMRTQVDTDAVINGIGNGAAVAPYGGTVYARVPAIVYLPGGKTTERKEVIRFDAVFAPDLVKGGTGLISHAGFVHDGGVNGILRTSVPKTSDGDITQPQDMRLQLGAVGALRDRTKRIEVKLSSRDGLLWLPRIEYLSQREIEALVPNPPPALKVFHQLTQ
jgi:hypothetical protein